MVVLHLHELNLKKKKKKKKKIKKKGKKTQMDVSPQQLSGFCGRWLFKVVAK